MSSTTGEVRGLKKLGRQPYTTGRKPYDQGVLNKHESKSLKRRNKRLSTRVALYDAAKGAGTKIASSLHKPGSNNP